jgi:FKBP-type peptidyl-prolyl cis-trans isomerase
LKIRALIVATSATLAIAGCAQAPETRTAAATPAAPAAQAAKPACAPPPRELEVKDLEVGKGDDARFRSAVLVNYTGWLYDGCAADRKGTMFDTSNTRVSPLGLIVGAGRVIKGWDEGLVGMREGGKRLLVIPPDKAYGANSPDPKIPPNSTLVFEVQLAKILQQPAPPQPK